MGCKLAAALGALALVGAACSTSPGPRRPVAGPGQIVTVMSGGRAGLHDGTYSSASPEVIRASAEERRSNPRSTSAKLRLAIRSG